MNSTGEHEHGETVVLTEVADELIADLPQHHAGRTARTLVTGESLRATVIALASGSELAEHDAPRAATLQVLRGSVILRAGDREWPLAEGQLATIPSERHSVHAVTDAAFLLSVALR
jgi:quercetin dioxygenase-like cupin family protein